MRSHEQRMSDGMSRRHSRSVYFAALMWLMWLLYMGPVIASLLASHPSPRRLIASLIGAATFVALYVWVAWWSAQGGGRGSAAPAPAAVTPAPLAADSGHAGAEPDSDEGGW